MVARQRATSSAVLGRRIGQTDGPDVLFSAICEKIIRLLRNQLIVQPPLSENFSRKPLLFLEINPQSNSPCSAKFA